MFIGEEKYISGYSELVQYLDQKPCGKITFSRFYVSQVGRTDSNTFSKCFTAAARFHTPFFNFLTNTEIYIIFRNLTHSIFPFLWITL